MVELPGRRPGRPSSRWTARARRCAATSAAPARAASQARALDRFGDTLGRVSTPPATPSTSPCCSSPPTRPSSSASPPPASSPRRLQSAVRDKDSRRVAKLLLRFRKSTDAPAASERALTKRGITAYTARLQELTEAQTELGRAQARLNRTFRDLMKRLLLTTLLLLARPGERPRGADAVAEVRHELRAAVGDRAGRLQRERLAIETRGGVAVVGRPDLHGRLDVGSDDISVYVIARRTNGALRHGVLGRRQAARCRSAQPQGGHASRGRRAAGRRGCGSPARSTRARARTSNRDVAHRRPVARRRRWTRASATAATGSRSSRSGRRRRAERDRGRRAGPARGDRLHDASNVKDTFVSLRNPDGSPVASFGTGGVRIDRSARTAASTTKALDVVFRPGGGLAVLIERASTPAAPARHGRDRRSFARCTEDGSRRPGVRRRRRDRRSSVGAPDHEPPGLMEHRGRLWVTGNDHDRRATGRRSSLASRPTARACSSASSTCAASTPAPTRSSIEQRDLDGARRAAGDARGRRATATIATGHG